MGKLKKEKYVPLTSFLFPILNFSSQLASQLISIIQQSAASFSYFINNIFSGVTLHRQFHQCDAFQLFTLLPGCWLVSATYFGKVPRRLRTLQGRYLNRAQLDGCAAPVSAGVTDVALSTLRGLLS